VVNNNPNRNRSVSNLEGYFNHQAEMKRKETRRIQQDQIDKKVEEVKYHALNVTDEEPTNYDTEIGEELFKHLSYL
jgi:hypothetical protein